MNRAAYSHHIQRHVHEQSVIVDTLSTNESYLYDNVHTHMRSTTPTRTSDMAVQEVATACHHYLPR
jgi:hypothetical protein